MTLTQEDYENEYWPRLDSAIHQLLAAPGQHPPLSYKKMHSCVYKCVIKQFADRLYCDLMSKVETHLAQTVTHQIADVDAKAYIEKFYSALNQYKRALGGIVEIFGYMNRNYVESKLGTDLRQELLKLFKLHVIDRHTTDLMPLLLDAQTKPFIVGPAIMAKIVKQLQLLSPELVVNQPQLFAKFIPNALPPTSEADREALRENRVCQCTVSRNVTNDHNDSDSPIILDVSREENNNNDVIILDDSREENNNNDIIVISLSDLSGADDNQVELIDTPQSLNDSDICVTHHRVKRVCPITKLPFLHPVVNSCGHTYEKDAVMAMLKASLEKGKTTCLCPVAGCRNSVTTQNLKKVKSFL